MRYRLSKSLSTVAHLALLAMSLTTFSACRNMTSSVSVSGASFKDTTTFSYEDFAATLKGFVDSAGKVRYAALKAERRRLDTFVATLAAAGPKSTPHLFPTQESKLAYYINAYNAFVLFNVTERYPDIDTVTDYGGAPFFYLTRFALDGETTNLYDLENGVIRAEFSEPRIHFALNCASAGCPTLPSEVFQPETLEEQLQRETTIFLHQKRNVEPKADALILSEIFDWYDEDFRPSPADWIRKNAPDLHIPATVKVSYRPYDWTLNDAEPQ